MLFKLKNLLPPSQQQHRYFQLSPTFIRTINNGTVINNNSVNNDVIGPPAQKTPLYELHLSKNGKLVNFENFMLPLQYANQSIQQSHLHTRKYASIFDVSHMLQSYVYGKHAIECMESICTADLKRLPNNTATLTLFTNENGGILDDLIITRIRSNKFYVVSNAGRIEQDQQLMLDTVKKFQCQQKDVAIEFLDVTQQALISIQGPQSMIALQMLFNKNGFDLRKLFFMQSILCTIGGTENCRITRCGYTGEDGFEISMPADKAVELVELLLSKNAPIEKVDDGADGGADGGGGGGGGAKQKKPDSDKVDLTKINVQLAGLGARDTLRLEAGLCLYGNDLDETITPIEAGLGWLVAKRRRIEANFPGSYIILNQLHNGCKRHRIGFRMIDFGPPARQGTQIYTSQKEHLGVITSGGPSPSLNYNIGMGYINDGEYKQFNKFIEFNIRDKIYAGRIERMPFLPTKYYVNEKPM